MGDGTVMERLSDKIKEIIDAFQEDDNVVTMSIPKDIRQRLGKDRAHCLALLRQVQDTMTETRQFITNRAREELSHQKHDEVYEQLNEALENGADLNPVGWAQAWLMLAELSELQGG